MTRFKQIAPQRRLTVTSRIISPLGHQKKPVRKLNKHQTSIQTLRLKKTYQKRKASLLLPKSTFAKLVRFICHESLESASIRFQAIAMMALQEATETFLINLFEDSFQCALHTHRVTLMVQDVFLVHRIRLNMRTR
jgi:histone H3